jgi:hypothetical protein
MSKLAFLLYYGGFLGLLAAYTVNDVWLDRTALVSLVLGCWLHARWWKRHIESVTTPVLTLVAAFDLLNAHRKEMDVFVRWMPRLFSAREWASKNEHLFIRSTDKSLVQAIRSLNNNNNNWEAVPVALIFAIPTWVYGIAAWDKRFLTSNQIFHDFMVHFVVFTFTHYISLLLTSFFATTSLRK